MFQHDVSEYSSNEFFICSGLSIQLHLLQINLAASHCTLSIFSVLFCVYEFQSLHM